jgi:hypothetical protein
MSSAPSRGLTAVGQSASGGPRPNNTDNSSAQAQPPNVNAAYRRLAAAIIGLDVHTLAVDLRRNRAA